MHEGVLRLLLGNFFRHQAHQDVDALAAKDLDIGPGLGDRVSEFRFPTRNTRKSVTAFDEVASRNIEEDDLHCRALRPLEDLFGRKLIGKLDVDSFEAKIRSGLETVKKCVLLQHHRNVDREAWHPILHKFYGASGPPR